VTDCENNRVGSIPEDVTCESEVSDEDVQVMAGRTAERLDGLKREIGRIADLVRRLGR
jgi:hypothetical protein